MMELTDLHGPFPAEDIEWRVQSCGEKNGKIWAMVLAYVTNRAIMARLDEVCGPANWQNEYRPGPHGGVVCRIGIQVAPGEWVWKEDGAENTDIEAVKGGLSGAMKRAAVQWGIGRYLYNLEEGWAVVSERGKHSGKTKDNKWFKWDPPTLPAWALPSGKAPRPTTPPAAAAELRKLAKHTDPETAAEIETKIVTGLTREEALALHADLKATLAVAGAAT